MQNKKKVTCETCEHKCPFINENGIGNCYIDMKEIDFTKDKCGQYKREKIYKH